MSKESISPARFLPDAQQRAAVDAVEGPLLLLAVPGSGKTSVLVYRLGHMVFDLGVPPESVTAVTYTVAAAADMKRRFISFFGARGAAAAKRIQFRTINGLCAAVIARCSRSAGREAFSLMSDEGAAGTLLAGILRAHGAEHPAEGDIRDARTLVTYAKNMLLTDDEAAKLELDCAPFGPVFADYRAYLRANALMDYDDQLIYAFRILQKYPSELAYWRGRARYLLVDEAQDTSKLQHLIIRLLAAPLDNLFMVGDEDQSIYGFRAAYPAALMDFERDHPGARVMFLERNYRSGPSLCALASKFIASNRTRREKRIVAADGTGTDTAIACLNTRDRLSQYALIADIAASSTVETAVLYRDNDCALPLIDLLLRRNTPFASRGTDAAFFTSFIVRDVRDLIMFAAAPSDGERFLRIYYKTSARIPKTAAVWAVEHAMSSRQNVLRALMDSPELAPYTRARVERLAADLARIPHVPASAAMELIACSVGYEEYLEHRQADPFRLRVLEAIAAHEKSAATLLERLDVLSDAVRAGAGGSGSPFILSTVHSAKGLEFERVILMDVADGILPKSAPAKDRPVTREQQEALEEERRILYVGMTRARRELSFIKYSDPAVRSVFMDELFNEKKPRAGARKPKPESPPLLDAKETAIAAARMTPGARIIHSRFGRGTVLCVQDGIIKTEIGGRERSFALAFAVSRGILRVEE